MSGSDPIQSQRLVIGHFGATSRVLASLALALVVAGCGTPASPAPSAPIPTAPTPVAPSGPRFLLAGESNAFFLRDCCLQDAVNVIRVGSIDNWLTSSEFAEKARTSDLIAFLWWQGNGDSGTLPDTYAQKLRSLIVFARAGNPALPVRIIEIPDTPSRAAVRTAQQQVAQDPGVELIPTADLPRDPDDHFLPSGYATVRDRINRSLGR